MSPPACRSNLLDVNEEVSGIHKSAATSAIAALLDETLTDAKLEDVVEDVVEEKEAMSVVHVSLPPTPMSTTPARIVGVAFAVVVLGFGVAMLSTRRAATAAPAMTRSTPHMAAASAPSVVAVPEVSIPAAIAVADAPAPTERAQPSESKPAATLADAEWMLRHGQVPRAEAIYRSILASGGSEHEALTGLGKVAIYNHQPTEALAFFERALARQPQYFPARLGRADALWDAGRRDSAKAHYAAIRERYPDNTIPARIVERARH